MKFLISIFIFIFILTGCGQTVQNPSVSYTKSRSATYDKIDERVKTNSIENKISPFEILPEELDKNTIAIIYPSNDIGKYSLDAINSINTYLIYKNSPFKVVMYDIGKQNEQNFNDIFKKLKEEKRTKIVALFTERFFDQFKNYELLKDQTIYFPLINKEDDRIKYVQDKNYNIIFGAICYRSQIDKLLDYAVSNKYIDLYNNSQIGTAIHSYIPKQNLIFSKEIDEQNAVYKNFLTASNGFNKSTVFLNTPIIKTSILLSQITALQLDVKEFLSTQLNYSPLIFSLTQIKDRKNITIASSIGHIPEKLLEVANLTNSDIRYNWVNYASIVGVELLSSGNIDLFKDLKLQKDEVIYPVYLYKGEDHSFKKID